MFWYLSFALLSLFIPAYYADQFTPFIVFLLASVSLVISTSIPFLIIYDLKQVPLEMVFRVVYWILFILGWVLIPYTQSVIKVKRKAVAANQSLTLVRSLLLGLKAYVKYYIVLGAVASAGLIAYVIWAQSFSWVIISSFCLAISNLYGVLLSLLCMGHGLLEIPKSILSKLTPQAPKYKNKLLSHLPYYRDYFNEAQQENHQMVGLYEYKAPSVLTTEGIKLQRAHAQYSLAMYDLLLISDREKLIESHSYVMSGHLMLYRLMSIKDNKFKPFLSWWYTSACPTLEGIYYRTVYTPIYGLLFLLTSVLSIVVLYYQTVFPFFPRWIPINFYDPDPNNNDVPVLMILLLLYMFYVTISTLYSVKVANLAMYPSATDAYALLFACVYTTRVVFPIAHNFVKISFGDTPLPEQMKISDFVRIMGKLNTVPILGQLDQYISLLLVILVLLNIFKIYDKIMALFQYEPELDIEEGKMVCKDNILALERMCRDGNITSNGYLPFSDEERLLNDPTSPPKSPPKRSQARIIGKQ